MVRYLLALGVTVNVHGLGPIASDAGRIILAVLAQVAEAERRKINERTAAGRVTAREHLERTGRTHKGKAKHPRRRAGAAWDRPVRPQFRTSTLSV